MIASAALLTTLLAAAGTAPAPSGLLLAQSSITIRSAMIVRVPVPRDPPPAARRWRTRKGPRCVAPAAIAGALIAEPDSVDMILRGGVRLRAELESACPALDFYRGFYLRPGPDGRVCADRDAIHARSGGTCGIERFRRLVPARRR